MTKITFEGQDFYYNHDRKIARITIEEPFYKAGKILNWDRRYGTAGLGINTSIIKFVLQTKSTLLVHVDTESRDYWLSYDNLKSFLKENNTEYRVRAGVIVNVISWRKFTYFPPR